MKKIKILFVSHEYTTNGSTMSLFSLVQGIKEFTNDIELEIVFPIASNKKSKARKLAEKNVIAYKIFAYRNNFNKINNNKKVKYKLYDFVNYFAVFFLNMYIRKKHFDIVCSNSTGVDIGARAALMAGVPHIYYVREVMEEGCGLQYRNKKRMKKLLETSNYIIFISKAVEKKYTSLYNLKNTTQFFDGIITQDYYIKNHNILQKEIISFVQVGTFGDGKGTLNTIDLLYKVEQSGITNWTMEFVGSGSGAYVAEMKNRIEKYHLQEKIIISDFCTKIKDILAVKDILIMNSRFEGFGRVTVEGMLAGCLVIGRNAGGTTEILTNGETGILFNEETEFLDVIKNISENREWYKKLANKGQAYALEGFMCVNTAKNFIKVVENCLNKN